MNLARYEYINSYWRVQSLHSILQSREVISAAVHYLCIMRADPRMLQRIMIESKSQRNEKIKIRNYLSE